MLKIIKIGCVAAAFTVVYGVVGHILEFPMEKNATIALIITLAMWRANVFYKFYSHRKQRTEHEQIKAMHDKGAAPLWEVFDPMGVPEYVMFLREQVKNKEHLWFDFEKIQTFQQHIAEAAVVAEEFMFILAVVLRHVHDHELNDTIIRMINSEKEVEEKALDALKDALRVGSMLYQYKIPQALAKPSGRTHLTLIAALHLRQKISQADYAHAVSMAIKSDKKSHICSNELKYIYSLPVVQARCLFYTNGGYYYKDQDGVEKKGYSPTKQHTDFLLFLHYMQDDAKNIFSGLVSDLTKITSNDYRCAMTIAFLKAFGSVPVEYAFFDMLVVSSTPSVSVNPS